MKKYLLCFSLLLLISCKRESFEPQDTPSPLDAQKMIPYSVIVPQIKVNPTWQSKIDSVLFNKIKDYNLIANTEDSCARFVTFRFYNFFINNYDIECVLWELPPHYAVGIWEHHGYYCFLQGDIPHKDFYIEDRMISVHSMPLYAYIDEPYIYLKMKYDMHKGEIQVVDSNRFYPPLLKDYTENEE